MQEVQAAEVNCDAMTYWRQLEGSGVLSDPVTVDYTELLLFRLFIYDLEFLSSSEMKQVIQEAHQEMR